MGIGHPGHKDAVAGYVLRDFPKADEGWLDDVLRGVSEHVSIGRAVKHGKDTPNYFLLCRES